MAIFFDEGTSSDGTMEAIGEIRKLAGKQCFLSGMSAIVTDTKNLAEKETPLYVLIAVVLAVIVLGLTMDSYFIPLLFMLSIGMAIIYNLGSNYFLGEISYITKALAAVLQLGVTLDYSIFLMHSYEEQQARYNGDKERAMAHAISQTFSSVIGKFRYNGSRIYRIVLHDIYAWYGHRCGYGKRCRPRRDRLCDNPSIHDPVL